MLKNGVKLSDARKTADEAVKASNAIVKDAAKANANANAVLVKADASLAKATAKHAAAYEAHAAAKTALAADRKNGKLKAKLDKAVEDKTGTVNALAAAKEARKTAFAATKETSARLKAVMADAAKATANREKVEKTPRLN
jgi:hypothetical protein